MPPLPPLVAADLLAATLPAFAAYVVDGTEVGVYDGSLTEWTADPTLPVEVG